MHSIALRSLICGYWRSNIFSLANRSSVLCYFNLPFLSDDTALAIFATGQHFSFRLSWLEMLRAMRNGWRTGGTHTLSNLCRWRRRVYVCRLSCPTIATSRADSPHLLFRLCSVVDEELHLFVSAKVRLRGRTLAIPL